MAKRRNQAKLRIVPQPDAPADVAPVDGGREYVAASGVSFAERGTVLPSTTINEDCLDPKIYRLMGHDPEVAKDLWLLVSSVLADGPSLKGVELPETDARAETANKFYEFHKRNLEGLEKPLADTLEKLLKEAIQYGNKVAEQTWQLMEDGPDAGLARHKSIKVKSRSAVQFVVDKFWNVLGLMPTLYGNTTPGAIIPRSKFVVLTLREEDEDPRGTSWLRPAANGWKFKQETWPIFFRFLKRVAIPSLVGKTAPGSKDERVIDADGNPVMVNGKPKVIRPQDVLLNALVNFENSVAIVVPPGAEVDPLETTHQGELYERTIEICNTEITNGILSQTRATNEAQHGSKADSTTAMTILDLIIWYLKGKICYTVAHDIMLPIHLANFGNQDLDLLPVCTLGDSERKDWATDATAAAELFGKVTPSQWLALLTQLGVPPPEEGEELPAAAPMPPAGNMPPPGGKGDPAEETKPPAKDDQPNEGGQAK